MDAADTLVTLDKHPGVRQALDQSGLGTAASPVRLDTGVIRISGRVGRPITQAVSRAVLEWVDDAHGIAYVSRLDSNEQCWALYDQTPVNFTTEPLTPQESAHRAAVRSVASLFEIELPSNWA